MNLNAILKYRTYRPSNEVYVLLLLLVLLLYVVYHTINGNRGIISMLTITSELRKKDGVLYNLQIEQNALEDNIKLLQPEHYDLDYIDELARHYFGMIGRDENIIILPPITN